MNHLSHSTQLSSKMKKSVHPSFHTQSLQVTATTLYSLHCLSKTIGRVYSGVSHVLGTHKQYVYQLHLVCTLFFFFERVMQSNLTLLPKCLRQPGLAQDARNLSQSLTWAVGIQVLGPSPTVFPGVLAGSWPASRAPGTHTQHSAQWTFQLAA